MDKEYTGSVEYTIHLGDFSETGNIGNYSVERNCSYTYTVNVEDVDRIVVEATKNTGKYQEGSEGAIYDYTKSDYAYILDAHYEQVYLEYNLSEIANTVKQSEEFKNGNEDKAIADALVLTIQSEAMDYEHEETDGEPYSVHNKQGTLKPYQIYMDKKNKSDVLDGKFDYKWVEFWPQTGTTIAAYPGVSTWSRDDTNGFANQDVYGNYSGEQNHTTDSENLMDVYDVIVAMGKVVKGIINKETITTSRRNEDGIIVMNSGTSSNPTYVARFTAFVNEYYYYRHPLTGAKITSWSLFTNKMPREMIVAMNTSVSTDGNSSYSELYSYISQLSIQTFYNSRKAKDINGFGIETYNETPLCFWGSPTIDASTLHESDGLSNQWELLESDYYDSRWEYYIDQTRNGWTKPLKSDYSDHKLEENAYSGGAKAYSACMSRNRDLNGNGEIEQDEVRWYLASLNEYIRMGIGARAISHAAQLYKGDKATMQFSGYPSDYAKDGSLYYTSSDNPERVYWAVEKGSYGAINKWSENTSDETTQEYVKKPIRCIRILPAEKDGHDISSVSGVQSDPTYDTSADSKGRTILIFKDRLVDALYRERTETSLNKHTEDDPENSFYDGIIVATDYLLNQYTLEDIVGYGGSKQTWGWTYDPNLEMENPCATLGPGWRVPNLVELSAMNAEGFIEEAYTGCCTRFSNINVRHGFYYETLWIACPGPGGDGLDSKVRIRCVRDVDDGYFDE